MWFAFSTQTSKMWNIYFRPMTFDGEAATAVVLQLLARAQEHHFPFIWAYIYFCQRLFHKLFISSCWPTQDPPDCPHWPVCVKKPELRRPSFSSRFSLSMWPKRKKQNKKYKKTLVWTWRLSSNEKHCKCFPPTCILHSTAPPLKRSGESEKSVLVSRSVFSTFKRSWGPRESFMLR